MSKTSKEPTGPYNPFYGCAIIFMAALIFGGILGWSFYSLTKQDSEIAKFTVEKPVPLVHKPLAEAELTALKTKLATFAEAAKAAKPATLTLSLAEINALMEIAPDGGFGKYTEMMAFKALKPGDSLVADVCLPLNKMRYWEGKRYAIGEATFVLDITKEMGPDLHIVSLTIPGKTVNEGFMQTFASSRWLTPYQKLPALTPIMKGIQKATVTNEGVVLSTMP